MVCNLRVGSIAGDDNWYTETRDTVEKEINHKNKYFYTAIFFLKNLQGKIQRVDEAIICNPAELGWLLKPKKGWKNFLTDNIMWEPHSSIAELID